MNALLTPDEVASRLRLSRRTVIVWLERGRLRGVKVGNRWRVREEDLTDVVEVPALDDETAAWLDANLGGELPPYDWGPSGPPAGKPVRHIPGRGLLIVEDESP